MLAKFHSNKVRNYPAFTLIEMLIVITIVGLIGAIAVGNYASSRKQAKLEIAVDGLISAFKEQAQKASGGTQIKIGSDLKSGCFGLGLNSSVQYLALPYSAVGAGNEVDSCNTALAQTTPYNSFEDLEIKLMKINEEQEVKELQVLYKPPFGKSVFKAENGEVPGVTSLKIVIGLKNTQDQRCLLLDNRTGLFTRLPNESC